MEETFASFMETDRVFNNENLDDSLNEDFDSVESENCSHSENELLKEEWTEIPGKLNTTYFSESHKEKTIVSDEDPYDYFTKMCSDEFVSYIVKESNKFLEKTYTFKESIKLPDEEISPYNKRSNYFYNKITETNMRKYIGLIFTMGIINLPNEALYWSNDNLFSLPVFGKVMTIDMFQFIGRYLHFNDNESENEKSTDKLYKIRPLIDMLTQNWRRHRIVSDKVSLDETMIAWKGRLGIKQYIPKKPTRYGIKVYSVADAYTGYVFDWEVYTGKGTKTYDAVKRLIERSNIKDTHIYFDSFFMTRRVIDYMRLNGNYITGTVKENKKGFPKVKESEVEENKCKFYKLDDIVYSVFNDKRLVRLASTFYDSSYLKVVKWDVKQKGKSEFLQPLMIPEYNKYAKGVDRNNQLVSYYNISKKSKKWYKKIFYYALELCLVNSYMLFKKSTNSSLALLEYKIIIAKRLLGFQDLRMTHSKISLQIAENQHFLKEIEDGKKKNCKVCSKNKKNMQKWTYFECDTCFEPLCVAPCFKNFHRLLIEENEK